MDEHVKMVPSLCTQCGGTVEVENVTATSDPMYYSVTRLTVQDGQIQEADQPEIVDSLDQYDFN